MKKLSLLILPLVLSACAAGGHLDVGDVGAGANLNLSNSIHDKDSNCKNNSSSIVQNVDQSQK